jgi:regulator of replication initiation timing
LFFGLQDNKLQKLQAMNQELVAKNLSLEIANEQLSETLMQIRQNPQKNSTAAKASDTDVVRNLREELEACQEHLAQKKELLAEALTQLKVFLKDEEMLESEIGENERLAQEVEDLKYDLEQSERARKWLAQRLSATGCCWSIFEHFCL